MVGNQNDATSNNVLLEKLLSSVQSRILFIEITISKLPSKLIGTREYNKGSEI